MEQIVRVRAVFENGTAQVLHVRQSACSGDCHKCSGCGAAQQAMLITARNPIGAKPGELVKISAQSAPVLKAAAVMYMGPMALFFAGYLLGALAWGKGVLTACIAFVLGIVMAVVYDRRVMRKQETVYTITGYAGQTLLKSREKGDNYLD